jgi:DNA modification methylase
MNKVRMRISDLLVDAVIGKDKVLGAPHDFYRYPARFSPVFAREIIRSFTKPGQLVLDPFCGSGTTVVEAMALGRRAAGIDISSLATFLTRVKTTPISVHDRIALRSWLERAEHQQFGLKRRQRAASQRNAEIHYHRNLPPNVRLFFESILSRLCFLSTPGQQNFVRLVLLSIGQCGIDCRNRTPSFAEMGKAFSARMTQMLREFPTFLSEVAKANCIARNRLTSLRRILNRSAEGIDSDGRIPENWLPAKLILTSPPYPGVHVLYHRWQLFGRREMAAPFWLANQRDGSGESFYTLGGRAEPELKKYFARLGSVFVSLRKLVASDSLLVQLVAFSDPKWQLPAYLDALDTAGFREIQIQCAKRFKTQGRIWREVPSRKWYAQLRTNGQSGAEVLLVHAPN